MCDTWTLGVTWVNYSNNMINTSCPSIHSFINFLYPLILYRLMSPVPSMHWPKGKVESKQESITAYIFSYLATVFSQPEFTHSKAKLTLHSSHVRNLHAAFKTSSFQNLLHDSYLGWPEENGWNSGRGRGWGVSRDHHGGCALHWDMKVGLFFCTWSHPPAPRF